MAVLITVVRVMVVPVTAETVVVPVMVGLETAAKAAARVVAAALVTAIPVTVETVAVPVTAVLAMAAKAAVQVVVVRVAAVRVAAAARVIPVVINPEAAAKAVPQSHQRNSLL